MKKYRRRYQLICRKHNKPDPRMQIMRTCLRLDTLGGLVFKLKLTPPTAFSKNKTKHLLLLSYRARVYFHTQNKNKFHGINERGLDYCGHCAYGENFLCSIENT